jgi:adenosine deaminase
MNAGYLHADPTRPKAFYAALPKVELHRHLEGSLRLDTMVEIAGQHGIHFSGPDQLRALVTVLETDPFTFKNFLSKFETLRRFYRSPEVIGQVAYEAVADAAADNVRYMELRFTPYALSVARGFPLGEVMDWVIEKVAQASREHQIQTRLIASMNRHEDLKIAEQVIQFAVDRKESGVVGIDLAGNEAEFSARPFADLFKDARQAGMHVTVHAGEWGTAGNISDALTYLDAERIGHGVRVLDDQQAVDLAVEREAAFEVCVTSNYQSGVVAALSEHPAARMLNAGVNVTLNTDDPSISAITLSDEYQLAEKELSLPVSVLKERVLAAARASFLPAAPRDALVQQLGSEFEQAL